MSINCVVTVRGVADCRNLTDGRTDIKCLSNGCKNLITLKDQTKKCIKVLEKYVYGNQV